jgi:hypothetical protein
LRSPVQVRLELDPGMKQHWLALLLLMTLSSLNAFAQAKVDLQANDTVHSVLARQVGQPVELRLKSGEKIAGKVQQVTDKLVHLSQLTEADFYDGVVDLESVAAVVVRVRSK